MHCAAESRGRLIRGPHSAICILDCQAASKRLWFLHPSCSLSFHRCRRLSPILREQHAGHDERQKAYAISECSASEIAPVMALLAFCDRPIPSLRLEASEREVTARKDPESPPTTRSARSQRLAPTEDQRQRPAMLPERTLLTRH